VLLSWDSEGVRSPSVPEFEEHFLHAGYRVVQGLEVSGGGAGVVSHAGLVLLRHLAGKTGLTGGLSRALATPRFLVHDRGRVVADLACAIADGARVISDFRVMGDRRELFGLVASVPTAWRTLAEIARAGGPCPGGEPRAVMRLFDFIQEAQNITTVSRGYAASAGTILLQAGRRRIIGSEGYLMIKNPALWMPDEEYLAEFADRVEKVLLARAAEAAVNGTADSPISQAQLRKNWNRTDWWLDSAEALKLGIVDGC
jgi:hypothetical protein